MTGLAGAAMAAAMWAAPDAAEQNLVQSLEPPTFAPAVVWYELAAEDAGYGDTVFAGRAGYDDGRTAFAVAAGWQAAAEPGWRNPVSITIESSRRLGGRTRIGAAFDYAQAPVRGGAPFVSLSFVARWSFD